jgi:hypothetical protein
MGQVKNVYKILIQKPEEKRPFRRPGHTWEDNIRMDRKEMAWGGDRVDSSGSG